MRTLSADRIRSWGLAVAASIWLLGQPPSVAGVGADPADPPRFIALESETAFRAAETLGENLFRELRRGQPNLVFSPLSASTALRMAMVGAGEMPSASSRAVLGSTFDADIPKQPVSPGSGVHTEGGPLTIANSLWAESSIQLADTFRRILADSFHAELRNAPFRDHPAAAAKEINSWVAGATREAIRELFPEGQGINASTRVLIANAVSFEAAWQTPFPRRTDSHRAVPDRRASGGRCAHDEPARTVPLRRGR